VAPGSCPVWARRTSAWRPDVVVAHAPVPGLAELTALAAGPIPFVLTYHSGSLLKGVRGVDKILKGYERHVLPWLVRRSAAVITYSPQFAASHLQGAGTRRVRAIPPGVDTEQFRPADSAAAKPTVLYVGRLDRTSRWKGVRYLLDAAALVARDVPDAVVELVGSGDDVEDLRSYARRRGDASMVHFRGALGGPDLAAAYRGARVVVLPSLTESESFGIVLLEASASGVPTVGSRIGGIPTIIRDGETGLLVPPGDSKALADALISLLTQDERPGGSVQLVVGWPARSTRGRNRSGERRTSSKRF
jgi:glycosyltransferase involved in cell wall biosynthesis